MDKLLKIWHSSGLYQVEPGQIVMMAVGLLLLYLAIKRNFEPLLLISYWFWWLVGQYPWGWFSRPWWHPLHVL